MLRIFTADPGSSNYGFAVVEVYKHRNTLRFNVVLNGLCKSTVRQLASSKRLRSEMIAYQQFIRTIRRKYQPNAIGAERYMPRGIGGNTIELVNFMIALLLDSKPHLPVKVIPAAQWKNAVKRAGVDLKAAYKDVATTPHQLDACLIGLYLGCMAYGHKDFGPIKLKKEWAKLLAQVEGSSQEPLNRNKLKRRAT